jgi:hypothetical protein
MSIKTDYIEYSCSAKLRYRCGKHGFLGDKYGPRNEISGSYPSKVRVTDSTIHSEII